MWWKFLIFLIPAGSAIAYSTVVQAQQPSAPPDYWFGPWFMWAGGWSFWWICPLMMVLMMAFMMFACRFMCSSRDHRDY